MNYNETKNSIDSLERFGSVLGLENIYELLRRLDNPQDKLKVIHVAGTNGKGSTIAFLSSILCRAGYRVGKYTSPVVFEYLEKYQINNRNISENDFTNIAVKVLNAVHDMVEEKKGQPTIFEVETAMAYLYFYESGCDVAVIETGMGGDMDATNVCKTVLASVIVSISLDHTGFLGETLENIATHKAGIIKSDCPVVLYGQSDEVTAVIRKKASELNAPLIIAKTDTSYEYPFTYKTAAGTVYDNLESALTGVYQMKNLAVALEVTEVLRQQDFDISIKAVQEGVASAVWHGRFEKICDEPLIIIDGAHNPGAVTELKATLERLYRGKKWIFVMGVLADKDFATEAELLKNMAEAVITVTPGNKRALEAGSLADAVKKAGVASDVRVADSADMAVELAMKKYDALNGDKGILAFGSLSYLGAFKECVKSFINIKR